MFSYRDRVRFYETDKMGVVYHANYLSWMSVGREKYLKSCGVDLNELMQAGYLFPIREVHVRYRHSAHFDDEYEVQTTLEKLTRASMTFSVRIISLQEQKVLIEGYTVSAFTDSNGKITRLPPEWFQKFTKLLATEN